MRNDDNSPRWPSWSKADGVGKFAYIMAGVWAFLILSAIFGW